MYHHNDDRSLMISISKLSSNTQKVVDYYKRDLRHVEQYYTQSSKTDGKWIGENALGLTDTVLMEDFRHALNGQDTNGHQLVGAGGEKGSHMSGWDMTFSAPKSVSLLWAVADLDTKDKIEKIQERAIESALKHAHDHYLNHGVRRAYKDENGVKQIHTERPSHLMTATFHHQTSRELDPNLHTHVLLANLAKREDGTFGALNIKEFYQHLKIMDGIYRAELAKGLQQDLTLGIERDRQFFSVSGVPKDLEKEFSKRREQILDAFTESEGVYNAKTAETMALMTRRDKEIINEAELQAHWNQSFQQHGFSIETLPRLDYSPVIESPKEVLERIGNQLTANDSTFTEITLKAMIANDYQGNGGVKEIEACFNEIDQHLISVGVDDHLQQRYTTVEMQQIEQHMYQKAKDLSSTHSHPVQHASIDRMIRNYTLNDEQHDSVMHVLQNRDLTTLQGMAGTGKSYAMNAVKDILEFAGYHVRGMAPTGIAAQNLQQGSGISSQTIDSFLCNSYDQLTAKDVVIVDEAGMIGSRKMNKLLSKIASSHAKVILIGDKKQLQSVDAGGAFRLISDTVGTSEMNQIMRQKTTWQREAVLDFANGNALDGLLKYHDHGKLIVAESESKIMTQLAHDFVDHYVTTTQRLAIGTYTNSDVTQLNKLIRDNLKEKGLLKNSVHMNVQSKKEISSQDFAVGDQIVLTKNSSYLNVKNGQIGTITHINNTIITVKTNTDVVNIDTTRYNHFQHAYALTIHKLQGGTIDQMYVKLNPLMSSESSYVAMSRQKNNAIIYASQKAFTGLDNYSQKKTNRSINKNQKMKELLHLMDKTLSKSSIKDTSLDYEVTDYKPKKNKIEPPLTPYISEEIRDISTELKTETNPQKQRELLSKLVLLPLASEHIFKNPMETCSFKHMAISALKLTLIKPVIIQEITQEIDKLPLGVTPILTSEEKKKQHTQITQLKQQLNLMMSIQSPDNIHHHQIKNQPHHTMDQSL